MAISFVRTFILYIMILVSLRVMGKRQISELQPSELVVTLLISDIAAIPMQDSGQPLLSGIVPILILVFCEIMISVLMLGNGKIRKLICGKPAIVIKNGKIDQKEMKALRMATEDLFEQLRQNSVFSLDDVEYAIIETNGKMSVLKKKEKESATREDMGIKAKDLSFPESVIISDGEISESSLKLCRKDIKWLNKKLEEENLKISDVFIMTANIKGDYKIIKKESKK